MSKSNFPRGVLPSAESVTVSGEESREVDPEIASTPTTLIDRSLAQQIGAVNATAAGVDQCVTPGTPVTIGIEINGWEYTVEARATNRCSTVRLGHDVLDPLVEDLLSTVGEA